MTWNRFCLYWGSVATVFVMLLWLMALAAPAAAQIDPLGSWGPLGYILVSGENYTEHEAVVCVNSVLDKCVWEPAGMVWNETLSTRSPRSHGRVQICSGGFDSGGVPPGKVIKVDAERGEIPPWTCKGPALPLGWVMNGPEVTRESSRTSSGSSGCSSTSGYGGRSRRTSTTCRSSDRSSGSTRVRIRDRGTPYFSFRVVGTSSGSYRVEGVPIVEPEPLRSERRHYRSHY